MDRTATGPAGGAKTKEGFKHPGLVRGGVSDTAPISDGTLLRR